MLGAEFKLPSLSSEEETADRKAPISLKFEIPYFTVSGIQVCESWCFLLQEFYRRGCETLTVLPCCSRNQSLDIRFNKGFFLFKMKLWSSAFPNCSFTYIGHVGILQVRHLKVIEKSGYQPLPWVRYITMAGEYELRLIWIRPCPATFSTDIFGSELYLIMFRTLFNNVDCVATPCFAQACKCYQVTVCSCKIMKCHVCLDFYIFRLFSLGYTSPLTLASYKWWNLYLTAFNQSKFNSLQDFFN